MSSRRTRGRPVDGVLLLDKPRGITSQTAVSRVKRLLGAAKAGHTGTLDPLADGLLPICLGEATKFSQGLLDAGKTYRARVQLGVRTTTGDLEGEIVERRTVAVTASQVEAALERFRGDIVQVPPMYSALKRDGKPLYAYARAGQEVPREPRPVHIARLELEAFDGDELVFVVACSKGTYVRVLAEDIGEALGCGACLAALTRLAVGQLDLAHGIALTALEAFEPEERYRWLQPVDTLVAELPRLDLGAADAARLTSGIPLLHDAPGIEGLARAYGPEGKFLGLVVREAQGRIVARRLVSSAPEPAAAIA